MLALMAVVMMSSCSHVISEQTRKSARHDVTFTQVAKDPLMYDGSLFIWGGVIVKTKITDSGATIEVRQSPLDSYGTPKDTDVSEGRFLVKSDRHLDPLIFEKDREVTVAGVLTGTARGRIGDTEYEYPVLEAREIYLWKEDEYYYYPYYDPWLFGPPYYYDQWGYGRPYRHHRGHRHEHWH